MITALERAEPSHDLTPADVPYGIVPRFHRLVRTRPTDVAVRDGRRRMSYSGLARTAALVREACRAVPGSGPVALLHTHDANALGAVLGVISSGHPLVVLDPESPAPRLQRLMARARAGLCITDTANAEVARRIAPRVAVTERLAPNADTLDSMWEAPPDPGSTALLAFTSGTTGRPKMLVNSHRMLVRDAWASSVGSGAYRADDVVAHPLPLAFHAGLTAALAALLCGATLELRDVRGDDAEALAGWLAGAGATVAHLGPRTLRMLAGHDGDPATLSLHTVTVTGEPLYAADAAALGRVLPPGCAIHHRYGSSETGLVTSAVVSGPEIAAGGALPVGRPVGDLRVDVVDDAGRPVGAGELGTVTVTGRDLGGGYRDDVDATAAAFTVNDDGSITFTSHDLGRLDADGVLHLLGRRDFSVRIGDEMVEPGEVDAVLHDLPGVQDAVTVGVSGTDAAPARLVAYVVPAPEAPLSADGIGRLLADRLPARLVPQRIVLLPGLPRTERGKIDRSALPPAPVD